MPTAAVSGLVAVEFVSETFANVLAVVTAYFELTRAPPSTETVDAGADAAALMTTLVMMLLIILSCIEIVPRWTLRASAFAGVPSKDGTKTLCSAFVAALLVESATAPRETAQPCAPWIRTLPMAFEMPVQFENALAALQPATAPLAVLSALTLIATPRLVVVAGLIMMTLTPMPSTVPSRMCSLSPLLVVLAFAVEAAGVAVERAVPVQTLKAPRQAWPSETRPPWRAMPRVPLAIV